MDTQILDFRGTAEKDIPFESGRVKAAIESDPPKSIKQT